MKNIVAEAKLRFFGGTRCTYTRFTQQENENETNKKKIQRTDIVRFSIVLQGFSLSLSLTPYIYRWDSIESIFLVLRTKFIFVCLVLYFLFIFSCFVFVFKGNIESYNIVYKIAFSGSVFDQRDWNRRFRRETCGFSFIYVGVCAGGIFFVCSIVLLAVFYSSFTFLFVLWIE